MAWRRETSVGTKKRTSASIEYSTISVPAKLPRSISGTWIWNTGVPSASVKGREYTGWRVSRAARKVNSDSVRFAV